jgi:hypothetical protein
MRRELLKLAESYDRVADQADALTAALETFVRDE